MDYREIYALWGQYTDGTNIGETLIRLYTNKQVAESRAEELNRVETKLVERGKRSAKTKAHFFVTDEQLAEGDKEYA